MEQSVVAVPPEGSISHPAGEEMYRRILAAARAARVYGSDVEDVAGEAWLIATRRGYFEARMLREAARNLGLWRVAREAEIQPDMVADTTDRDAVAAVRKAMGQLSSASRALIYMSHFRGDTIPEIAAATGDSVGTVHAHLKEVEETLRRVLADYVPMHRRKSKPDADLPLFGEVAV